MIAIEPLLKPHVDWFIGQPHPANAAGEEEVERRAQELLNEWFGRYFNGLEFQTPVSETETGPKILTDCLLLWGQAAMPSPLEKPVIHVVLTSRRDEEDRVEKNLWRVKGRWTWSLLVRVPAQLPAKAGVVLSGSDSAGVDAERICRRVGDQCRWLLKSAHVQELAVKGISHLTVDNGPQQIPGGAWHLRQIVFSAEVNYRRRSNMP